MRAPSKSVGILRLVTLGVVLLMAFPLTTFAQGRGRGRDKDFEKSERKRQKEFEKFERKREKFINGHDARDGRWDGRGPDRFRERRFDDRFTRVPRVWQRNRNFDDGDFRRFGRQRNRDFDDDDSRRLRRLRRRNLDDEEFLRLRRQQLLNRGFEDNTLNQNGLDWGSLLNLLWR